MRNRSRAGTRQIMVQPKHKVATLLLITQNLPHYFVQWAGENTFWRSRKLCQGM